MVYSGSACDGGAALVLSLLPQPKGLRPMRLKGAPFGFYAAHEKSFSETSLSLDPHSLAPRREASLRFRVTKPMIRKKGEEMDEQQTLTAAQLWEMFLPHVVAGLKEASAHFRANCPPALTIDWACKVIENMPAPGGKQ